MAAADRGGLGAAALVTLVAALAPACRSTAASWTADWTSPYAAFSPDGRERFQAARSELDRGERVRALADLRALSAEGE